jgi:carbamoyltransferase
MNKLTNVSHTDIANYLFDKKVVAIFNGRSEAGPRALGNRSMLYTPTDPNGKEYINTLKGREQFRPLAASILHEYANDWFDMMGIEESPHMTFSFRARADKVGIIPCVIHVDGSCRIQTVKEHQNYHYYNLIKSFYELSGVPILLNTSFNLAGEPIVETVDDALRTFKNSKIDILYFPELKTAIKK